MKAKIRTRTGTRKESQKYAADVAARKHNGADDARCLALPDGDPNAVRVEFNRDTGEVLRDRDGEVRISAPWLLCGIFA